LNFPLKMEGGLCGLINWSICVTFISEPTEY